MRIAQIDLRTVDKAKNQGFLFDHQLNLNAQINAVSQVCYVNQKIGSKLSFDLMVQMVHSNILFFVDYCTIQSMVSSVRTIFKRFKRYRTVQSDSNLGVEKYLKKTAFSAHKI